MNRAKILIVDDEIIARENLEHILRKEGYETIAAENGLNAIKELEKNEFDLVMTDLRMQPVDGIQVLKRTKELYPDTEVVIITGFATVNTAVDAMKNGAYHYVPKPYKFDEVRVLVEKAIEKRSLRKEVADLKRQVKDKNDANALIGNSPQMEALRKLIEQISPLDCNVLILGETGTGKELVAKTIHKLSQRSQNRFLAINCGAFNEELLANELFGHEKEAFTGAKGIKKGLIEVAEGGTVFLDEIGDMPLSMQVKLLRVIQERSFIRVGGTDDISANIRIIAATNKDLKQEAEKGTFRQDLFFRLNVISLVVPRLAERKDDILFLSLYFMRKISESYGKKIDAISDEVMDILLSYQFPGNVRELENIIERAVALARGTTIEAEYLSSDLRQLANRIYGPKREFVTLEDNEKAYITWVLEQVADNKTKAAEILGIDRVSLWRKLKRYNL